MKWLIEDLAEFGRIDEGSKVKLKGQWWVVTSTSINGWCELQECEAPVITAKIFTKPLRSKTSKTMKNSSLPQKNSITSLKATKNYYDITISCSFSELTSVSSIEVIL